jgi:hypothetical protein
VISTADILKATGLRSGKTLTRWHQRGLIPEPVIGTHPSGRGKMAFWPDWVLDRCVRIVALQRQGHTLNSAVTALEMEQLEETITWAKNDPTERMEKVTVKVGKHDVALLDLFAYEVINAADALLKEPGSRSALLRALREERVIQNALLLLSTGHNPVALFESGRVNVVPDFVVGHRLTGEGPDAQALLVVPMLAPLRAAFARFGKELPSEPRSMPAPLMWAKEGDALVQYEIYPGGAAGFEVLRHTARVLGSG